MHTRQFFTTVAVLVYFIEFEAGSTLKAIILGAIDFVRYAQLASLATSLALPRELVSMITICTGAAHIWPSPTVNALLSFTWYANTPMQHLA